MADGVRPARRQELNISWHRAAEVLVKAYDIHEGYWRAALRFGAASGFNAQLPGGVTVPSVWVPAMGIVLIQEVEESSLTIDASVVNPRPKPVDAAITADDIPSSGTKH